MIAAPGGTTVSLEDVLLQALRRVKFVGCQVHRALETTAVKMSEEFIVAYHAIVRLVAQEVTVPVRRPVSMVNARPDISSGIPVTGQAVLRTVLLVMVVAVAEAHRIGIKYIHR